MVIGTVQSGNPLTVAARNGLVSPGRLSTGEFMTGGVVAMLRQGATWLALGQVIGANGVGGLGITQIAYAEASGTLNLTAADQPVPGMTATVTTTNPNAMCLCFWTTEFITLVANTSTSNCQLYLDGVAQGGQGATQRADAANQRGTYGTFNWFAAGLPGSHTIVAQGRTSGGAGIANINNSNTNMLVVVIE
jgi:hypothetical protein